MPRFFIDKPNGSQAIVTGADANHIGRSLRMKLGDELILCNNGIEYITKIASISDNEVVCDIEKTQIAETEPSINITLFQAIPKSDKMEFIIQKSVELGVTKICPVLTERCVSRPDLKSFNKKKARWEKIALEAAKQSGRGIIPEILDILSFDECIGEMKKLDRSFMCYEKGGKKLTSNLLCDATQIGLLIGSEGGFEQSEADKAEGNSIILTGLGKRILRCETAPIAAVSIIMSLTGNM